MCLISFVWCQYEYFVVRESKWYCWETKNDVVIKHKSSRKSQHYKIQVGLEVLLAFKGVDDCHHTCLNWS